MTTREPAVRGSATEARVVCVLCGEPVNVEDRHGSAQREITGWEELRIRGGANKISDRKTTGRWRHTACRWEVAGQTKLDLDEPSLFDETGRS